MLKIIRVVASDSAQVNAEKIRLAASDSGKVIVERKSDFRFSKGNQLLNQNQTINFKIRQR